MVRITTWICYAFSSLFLFVINIFYFCIMYILAFFVEKRGFENSFEDTPVPPCPSSYGICPENKGVHLPSLRKWAVMELVYAGELWGILALCCEFGIPVARLQHQSALLIWYTYCLLLFLSLPIQTSPPPPFYTVLYLWLGVLLPPQVGYKTAFTPHQPPQLKSFQVGEENCVLKISLCACLKFKGVNTYIDANKELHFLHLICNWVIWCDH